MLNINFSISLRIFRCFYADCWLFRLRSTPVWHDKPLPCIFRVALTLTAIGERKNQQKFTQPTENWKRRRITRKKYRINVNLHFVTMPFTRAEGSIYSNCRSALLLNANNTFSTAEFHIQIWILKHSKPFKYRTTIKYVLRNHNFS